MKIKNFKKYFWDNTGYCFYEIDEFIANTNIFIACDTINKIKEDSDRIRENIINNH